MTDTPDWWGEAEEKIGEVIIGFSEGLKTRLIKFGNKPMSLLGRKSPFLFRVRGKERSMVSVWSMVDASLSSSEETQFGGIFEKCAEIVCGHGKRGQKSGIEGIDLEYSESFGKRVLIQVKSGKNWGNSSRKAQLEQNFRKASRVLKQGGSVKDVRCIEGISYGKKERKNSHERIVGADFWQEISGWDGLYFALMGTVGKHAGNGLQEAKTITAKKVAGFMREKDLLEEGDKISWENLILFLSEN